MTSFAKDVPLGGFVDMPPHLGGQMPQNPNFRGEKCRFPAKLVKSKNMHIIKTTASISTKFCTAIKTTRLVAWLEFNVPFQHKYSYIRDQIKAAFIKSHGVAQIVNRPFIKYYQPHRATQKLEFTNALCNRSKRTERP